jgi:carboxyl-terminal processing protease
MRVIASILLLTWAIICWAREDCMAQRDYDAVVRAVTEKFHDKTFGGLDWPARVEHYRKRVSCRADPERVAAVVNGLLAELKASHLGLYTRKDFHYWGLNSMFSDEPARYALHFAGVWPERHEGRWFAKYVLEDSPAARAGIAAGDQLIRLNGAAFEPFSFTGGIDSVVISPDGSKRRTVQLRAEDESVIQAFVDASVASRRIFDAHGKRVGYFHIWVARDRILEALEEAIADFDRTRVDAVILDLRGGYGGTSKDYLDALRSSAHLMQVPKLFLIDDGVRSGKEMLAAIVRRDALGTLVGSRTSGSFLGATVVRFDERYLLLVAAFGGALDDLPAIEGVGVSPDVEVLPCRRRCKGHDPQLTRALSLVSSSG